MTINAYAILVDELVSVYQLLNRDLLVGEPVVAQVAVAVVVLPLGARRVTPTVAHGHHDEAELRKCRLVAVG